MRFRSPAEDDTRNFRQYGRSSTVITAQAGIQVCFPAEVAWIPALRQRSGHAFTGMTKPKGAVILRVPARLFSSDFEFPRWVIGGS